MRESWLRGTWVGSLLDSHQFRRQVGEILLLLAFYSASLSLFGWGGMCEIVFFVDGSRGVLGPTHLVPPCVLSCGLNVHGDAWLWAAC